METVSRVATLEGKILNPVRSAWTSLILPASVGACPVTQHPQNTFEQSPVSRFVVVSGLEDDEIFVLDQVDQAMLGVDPSGPTALKDVAKRFRFADPGEGVTHRVLDQSVDPFERLLVDGLPVQIVGPAVGREDQPH